MAMISTINNIYFTINNKQNILCIHTITGDTLLNQIFKVNSFWAVFRVFSDRDNENIEM